jgi:hypothetical protein
MRQIITVMHNYSHENSRCGIGADLAPINIGGTSEGPNAYREPRMSDNAASAILQHAKESISPHP